MDTANLSNNVQPSLKPEDAFLAYRRLAEQGDSLFFKSALFSMLCLSTKYLGLDLTEIEAAGAKMVLANPRFITGALGWVALFYLLASIVRSQEAALLRGHCEKLAEVTDIAHSAHAKSMTVIGYFLLLLLLLAFILLALVASFGDMLYLLKSFVGRAIGFQDFVGPFDICVEPKV